MIDPFLLGYTIGIVTTGVLVILTIMIWDKFDKNKAEDKK